MRARMMAVMVAVMLACAVSAHAGEKSASVALAKRVAAAKFADIPLNDALDFVRDVAGINIDVDWKTLEAAGITRDTPIALDVHDVTAGRLLKMVLAIAGTKERLTAYIDDNVVQITTRAADDAIMIIKVYDVTDLISLDDHFNPIANVGNMGSMNGVSGAGGSNGQNGANSGFGNSGSFGGSNNGGNSNGVSNKEAKANHLIQVIQAAVRPDVWQVNGGKATISYFNNQLIVSAPRSVQRLIGG